MPVFQYQATDQKGRNFSGAMPAHDETNLEERLRQAGLWLIDASIQRPAAAAERQDEGRPSKLALRSRGRRRTLIEFCTLMSFQIRVGVPIVQALEVAIQDCEDPTFRQVLAGMQKHLEAGLLFHQTLEKYPKVFSEQFISVVRAGETSSKLPETFEDLGSYLEWVEKIIADVRQASLYPAIVSVVIFAFVLFLFSFIIPKFAGLLTGLHIPLPMLTQIIFGAGDFFKASWWAWLIVLTVVVVGIPLAQRRSAAFAYSLDQLKLRLPIFGDLNMMLAISRFTHNFAILYRSGIPILQSLQLCQGLIGSPVVERATAGVHEDVKTGSTLSEGMRRQPVFPPLLLRMTVMGETTGSLDTALENVADYYNQVIPRRIKKIFTVVEPMLMLLLIGIVGAVALAIYLPLLALMGSIR
ncbi:MAG TPA: type II secretion system F family protein [Candidatus Saccharimonadales bacterium]|nr:type II secretion system F family protein [Candidatus Saccharimonadales bacterium]